MHRDELLAGLGGRAIEVVAGNGLNFDHYPTSVAEVVAVEPDSLLRAIATGAAARSRAAVRAIDGVADALYVESESFDAGVASLVLCSVPDQMGALGELRRVLRPGGELRFYEHVVANTTGLAGVQPSSIGRCGRSSPLDATRAVTPWQRSKQRASSSNKSRRFSFKPFRGAFVTTPHMLGKARRL